MPKFTPEEIQSLRKQGFSDKLIVDLAEKGTFVGGEQDGPLIEAKLAAITESPTKKSTPAKQIKIKTQKTEAVESMRMLLGAHDDLTPAATSKTIRAPQLASNARVGMAPDRLALGRDEDLPAETSHKPTAVESKEVRLLGEILDVLKNSYQAQTDEAVFGKEDKERSEDDPKPEKDKTPWRQKLGSSITNSSAVETFKDMMGADMAGQALLNMMGLTGKGLKILTKAIIANAGLIGKAGAIILAAVGTIELGKWFEKLTRGNRNSILSMMQDEAGKDLSALFGGPSRKEYDATRDAQVEAEKNRKFDENKQALQLLDQDTAVGKLEKELDEAIGLRSEDKPTSTAPTPETTAPAPTPVKIDLAAASASFDAASKTPTKTTPTTDNPMPTSATIARPTPAAPAPTPAKIDMASASASFDAASKTPARPTPAAPAPTPAKIDMASASASFDAANKTPTPSGPIAAPNEPKIVSAVDSKEEGQTLIATMEDGSVQKRRGDVNWRANNPGNIRWAPDAIGGVRGPKTKGKDGYYAIFADLATGEKSRERLLYGPMYKKKKLSDAIAKWAPEKDNNNTKAYQAGGRKSVGGGDPIVEEMTPEERKGFHDFQIRHEGKMKGRITQISGPTDLRTAQNIVPTDGSAAGSSVVFVQAPNVSPRSGPIVVQPAAFPVPVEPRNNNTILAALQLISGFQ